VSLHNLPIASRINFANKGRTLADLEASLHYARRLGAPDDAEVIPTAPGSCYLAEVQWIDREGQQ
jgi:hypothetical protein